MRRGNPIPVALWLVVTGLLLAACSGARLDSSGVDRALTPQDAQARSNAAIGRRVLWAGTIVHASNLKQSTQLEVLAYPPAYDQRPDTSAPALGRFLLEQPGYLETADYAAGRQISVVGRIAAPRNGRIGEREYTYPVLQAEQLHLWEAAGAGGRTQFHFGIGAVFH